MKLSHSWLRDHITSELSAAELAERLTGCGMNVEVRDSVGDDEVWDVDITTNRPDAMNHHGLAREAAAAGCGTLRALAGGVPEGGEAIASLAAVTVEDGAGCARYCARVIRGVTVGPSPTWLVERLEHCGIRSINTVVDATNYVLLDLGQPLHAFDLDRLAGRRIVVRRARGGERLTTLDGIDRTLDPSDLVIADAERAMALAGVMGGGDSEITVASRDILIESAYFDALSVRRTARRHGLATEASHRFERGCDREMARLAVDRVAALIVELAGGVTATGVIDVQTPAAEPRRVAFSLAGLARFTGCPVPRAFVLRVLQALGFEPRGEGDDVICTVPSHRVDIELAEDLYEEVLRHFGYDNIPSALPVVTAQPGARLGSWPVTERARDAVAAAGLAEAVTYAFLAPELEAATASSPLAARGAAIALDNPLSVRMSVLRRSLLGPLAEAAAGNLRRGAERVALAEVARVFHRSDGQMPGEERLGVVLAGGFGGWDSRRPTDFLDLKGVVETLLEQLGVSGVAWRPAQDCAVLAAGEAAEVVRDGEVVAIVGRLADAVATLIEAPLPLWVAEIDLAPAGAQAAVTFRAIPRFPAVVADLTVRHRVELPFAELAAAVRAASPAWLEDVAPVVRYSGEGVAAGEVKTTLRLVYRMQDRSLTQEEVNGAHFALMDTLARRLGVSFQ